MYIQKRRWEETIGHHWKPLETIWKPFVNGNRWKPLETMGNHWKTMVGSKGNHWKVVATWGGVENHGASFPTSRPLRVLCFSLRFWEVAVGGLEGRSPATAPRFLEIVGDPQANTL